MNTYKQVNPESISPVETSWQHGMEQWISNRQMAIKAISQDLGLSLIQSELYAMFNKAGEHLPGYKSSGHWGRWHLLRMTLVPDEMAMIKLEVDGMTLMQEKIKQEKEYYQEIISSSEITTIKITQFNQSHSTMYNPVHLTRFEINDQSMLDAGVFYAQPPMQIRGKYLPKDLMSTPSNDIKCDGYWEIKTNGVNILT